MLTIGDFARHAGVSVRMLRHYDQLGLLVPAQVDPVSGYRSYSASQLRRANRLVALKDLGFTLEQVGQILSSEIGVDELRGMLRLRQTELSAQIAADRDRLQAVEQRLRTIESEGTMSELEYVEKSLPTVRVAQVTAVVDGVEAIGPRIGPMFDRLGEQLASAGLSLNEPALAWYDSEGDGVLIAAAFPTTVSSLDIDGVEVTELPAAGRALTVVHHGSMTTIGDTWQALATRCESLGLQPEGRCREVYLETPQDEPDAWVTELQQPVA